MLYSWVFAHMDNVTHYHLSAIPSSLCWSFMCAGSSGASGSFGGNNRASFAPDANKLSSPLGQPPAHMPPDTMSMRSGPSQVDKLCSTALFEFGCLFVCLCFIYNFVSEVHESVGRVLLHCL